MCIRDRYINEIPDHTKTKYNKVTMNTMKSNNDSNNNSHKKHSCINGDAYKIYSVNGVHPAETREILLSNDNDIDKTTRWALGETY